MSAGDYSCTVKFCSRSPSGHINMEFSFPSYLSDDFNLLMKSVKKSFTQNIKRKKKIEAVEAFR